MIILISLILQIASLRFVTSFYSAKELEIFDVLLKPYGVNLSEAIIAGDVISKIPPANQTFVWNCTGHYALLKTCNVSSMSLASRLTTKNFSSSLTTLQGNCPRGSFSCFHNQVISDQRLRSWFQGVKEGIKKLCKDKCWRTLEFVSSACLHPGKSGITERDKSAIQFANQALDSLCLVGDGSLSCAEKFINGLQKNSNKSEVCNVKKYIAEKGCTTTCYEELDNFYGALGCCVGYVSKVMKCNRITPRKGSFGVLFKDSYPQCHKATPSACGEGPKGCAPAIHTTPSPASLVSGKKIAGICLAVVVCTGVVAFLVNYVFRRIKRKEKIRFEDYGYSRLKMMEDELYVDVEDEDAGGFIQL